MMLVWMWRNENTCALGGDYKLVQPIWKNCVKDAQKLRTELPYNPATHFLGT